MSVSIRGDFPVLSREIDGQRVIYLDSAATALKPQSVIDAERDYETLFTANVHRGASTFSDEASYRYEAARHRVARFIGADPACVIFVPNTTYALAMVATGLKLSRDDTVLCSPNGHHSNLLPWLRAASVAYIEGDPLRPLEPEKVETAIQRHRPKVVAFGWGSNVNGAVSPARDICTIAREYGVISVVDGAQAVPHLAIDVVAADCDFLAFSGHKLLGPSGTGVLWGRRDLLERLDPLVVGGGTVDRATRDGFELKRLPHRLEPGTPNVSGVLGLGAAIEYLDRLGLESRDAHRAELSGAMHDALKGLCGVTTLHGDDPAQCLPIVSLIPSTSALSADLICRMLSDGFKIMTRSGYMCAHPLFETLSVGREAVRLSAYLYNEIGDIESARAALHAILRR